MKVKKLSFRVLSFVPAEDHVYGDTPVPRCHPHVTSKQLPPEHPFSKQCCFSSRNQTTVSFQMTSSHCQKESKDDKGRMWCIQVGLCSKEGILSSTQDVHSYSTGIPPSLYAFTRTPSCPLCPKYSSQQYSLPPKAVLYLKGNMISCKIHSYSGQWLEIPGHKLTKAMLEEQSCKPVRKRKTMSYISNITSLPLPKAHIQAT